MNSTMQLDAQQLLNAARHGRADCLGKLLLHFGNYLKLLSGRSPRRKTT